MLGVLRGRLWIAAALFVTFALGVVAAMMLTGGERVEPSATATQTADVSPDDREADVEDPTEADQAEADYWSDERVSALEEAKDNYEPPAPSAPEQSPDAASRSETQQDRSDSDTGGDTNENPSNGGAVRTEQVSGHLIVIPALREEGNYNDDGSCPNAGRAKRGYDDIHDGAEVRVLDGSGSVIGVGRLRGGSFRSLGTGWEACGWDFGPIEVGRSDFYKVEVSHRDGVTYSHEELDAAGWEAQLSL